jgi:hypothetical protein
MASERRRLAALVPALAAAFLLGPATPVAADQPWWTRVAFAGRQVGTVRVDAQGAIAVDLGSAGQQASSDGGRTWHRIFERHGLVIPPDPRWQERDGRIGQADPATGAWHADPQSPRIELARADAADSHGLLAAPRSRDGVVVAVARDGVVWRRGQDGGWARALLLLPQGIAAGPPRVTGVTAFAGRPLSDAVYLATDGYSVLESLDGGDDWIRAGPGLSDHVLGIAAGDNARAVYAATDDGLWVHHLQPTPSPPNYPAEDLHWRWLGVALVTLAAAAVSIGGLLRYSVPRRTGHDH